MADLPEASEWTAAIYQLETSDPVLGGPEGIDNLQAKQLANRTVWLKALAEQLDTGKQDSDATLAALAGLAMAANQMIYSTGPDAFAMTALTAFIRTLLGAADAATARTTLGAAPLASPTFTDDPKAPTPAQFDNDTSLMTTAFAKRMGVEWSNFNSINAGTVLTATSVGGVVSAASATAINVTLPPTAGIPHGAAILLVSAGAGAVTLLTSGADLLTNQSGAQVPVVLGLGDSALFVKVTGEWRLLGGSVSLAYAKAFLDKGLAAGQVGFFSMTSAPQGWLKCNGAAVSRTTYAALFTAIGTTFGAGDGSTTFNLPDLRGEFLRGWDDGRGVDSGRVLGSAQSGAIESHSHRLGNRGGAAATSPSPDTGEVSIFVPALAKGSGGLDKLIDTSAQSVGATNNTGGSETRPRNVALLYCIKY